MSVPSDKAVEAAKQTYAGKALAPQPHEWKLRGALNAAHDPALGPDCSVCLRDVVEAVRQHVAPVTGVSGVADFIEREFGGGA